MELLVGIIVLLWLAGIGSSRWRNAIGEKVAECREDRRLRRKYDL